MRDIESFEDEICKAADQLMKSTEKASRDWAEALNKLIEKYSSLPDHLIIASVQNQIKRIEKFQTELEAKL